MEGGARHTRLECNALIYFYIIYIISFENCKHRGCSPIDLSAAKIKIRYSRAFSYSAQTIAIGARVYEPFGCRAVQP